ncbi:TonB C-terminal domain-containing protein, partial [Gammaproteobacteria bacterium]|nr:TonB C-terminal domain-containing protein [Gammaproteobacteria bacterium]
ETKKSIDDIAKIDSEGSISNLKNLLTQESEILNSGDLENEINTYSGYMISLIEAAWIKPKNIQDNLICDIKIKTNSRGRIINITLLKSSGNIRFDNSALQAVKRVETFPFFNEIKKTTYEDAFKNIVISFNPSK